MSFEKYTFGINRTINDDSHIAYKAFSGIMRDILLENADTRNNNRVNNIVGAFDTVVKHPPEFDVGRFWAYAMLAGSIAAAKKTEHIWKLISSDTRDKLDLVMKLFLYTGAYITHKDNDYRTGFRWKGHWAKTWSPNHRFAARLPMIYAINYFGGIDNVNSLLSSFNFDETMKEVRDKGFDRCYALWSADAVKLDEEYYSATVKELLENGGQAYVKDEYGNVYSGGSGVSIRTPYKFYADVDDDLFDMIEGLLIFCYSGGEVVSKLDMNGDGVIDAYIDDDLVSPMEGREGMMLELKYGGGNFPRTYRSSPFFCINDFILATSLIAFCKAFKIYDLCENRELWDKIVVGNTDFDFKLTNGYHGGANGRAEYIPPRAINVSNKDYVAWREYWNTYLITEEKGI